MIRNVNIRLIFRVNGTVVGALGAVPNDGNKVLRGISWIVRCTEPSNDNKRIVQKGKIKKDINFSYCERKTFYKNVPNAAKFLFDLGMESEIDRMPYMRVGF